jgi:hypothetical protein
MTLRDPSDSGITPLNPPAIRWRVVLLTEPPSSVEVTYAGLEDVEAVIDHLRTNYPAAREVKFGAIYGTAG